MSNGLNSKSSLGSPSPHKGMVVSIETGQTFEDIVIGTRGLLPLLGTRAVIPGIVDKNLELGFSQQCEQQIKESYKEEETGFSTIFNFQIYVDLRKILNKQ